MLDGQEFSPEHIYLFNGHYPHMLDNTLTRPALARALSTIADTQPNLSDVLASGRSAWLSHLILNGIDPSLTVSPDAVALDRDIADPEHLGYAKSGCAEASQRLLLHHAVTDKLDVDSIRLDGRPCLFELIQPLDSGVDNFDSRGNGVCGRQA